MPPTATEKDADVAMMLLLQFALRRPTHTRGSLRQGFVRQGVELFVTMIGNLFLYTRSFETYCHNENNVSGVAVVWLPSSCTIFGNLCVCWWVRPFVVVAVVFQFPTFCACSHAYAQSPGF